MIMIILKVLLFIVAASSLNGCTTIKVVEVEKKIAMPKFDYQCKELELLSGVTFLDALNTMKNNEVIHQECINLAEQQNIFIKKLAN